MQFDIVCDMDRYLAFLKKWAFSLALCAFGVYAAEHLLVWLASPWQNEFREGIVLPVADCFLRGGSPYDGHTAVNLGYVYGFIPSLLVAGIQALFGVGSRMLENRLLSVGCLLATAALVEREALRLSNMKIPRFLAFAIMIPAGWNLCEVVARPDYLAVLLSVLAVIVLLYKTTWTRIAASALCTILAFYSKQYLILIGFPIFIYLLTVDFRKALGYGFLSAFLLCASIIIVNAIYPLYFSMAIFCMGTSSDASMRHMFLQTAIFGWFYWPIILIILLGIIAMRHEKIAWGHPSPTRLVALATLSGAFFLTAFLGGNSGAVLTYYLQLLLPWTLLWAAALLPSVKLNRFMFLAIAFGTLFFSVWHFGPFRPNPPVWNQLELRFGAFAFTPALSKEEHAEWQRLKEKLSSFPADKVIVESPACCALAFAAGIPNYEAGHGFKWSISTVCERPSAVVKALPWLATGATAAYDRWKIYHNDLSADLKNGRLEAVLVSADREVENSYDLPPDTHYEITDRFTLRTGYQTSAVTLYTRKSTTTPR